MPSRHRAPEALAFLGRLQARNLRSGRLNHEHRHFYVLPDAPTAITALRAAVCTDGDALTGYGA